MLSLRTHFETNHGSLTPHFFTQSAVNQINNLYFKLFFEEYNIEPIFAIPKRS
jgi:hypothetical protein